MSKGKRGIDIPRLLDANVDLIAEVDRLRDINKDLLEALRECMGDSYILIGERKFAKDRYEMAKAAIAKYEGAQS